MAFAERSPARHSQYPRNPFHARRPFRGFHSSHIRYGLPVCSPPCTDPTSFLAVGDFYIQASGVSVTLPAAGYDYNSDWTPLLAGLSPAGMTASLAARSLRSPGDPSCAFAPLLDPGRTDVPSPWRSHRCCPRFVRQRRLRTMRISGLTHAASAPALLRFAFRVATHAQGWLPAGWLAFTGRASNPLDHYERFQITWSSPFPVLLTLLTFRTRARLSFAPSTCRMPPGPSQASPKLIPEAGSAPSFDIV
jgi:hypothetical protein